MKEFELAATTDQLRDTDVYGSAEIKIAYPKNVIFDQSFGDGKYERYEGVITAIHNASDLGQCYIMIKDDNGETQQGIIYSQQLVVLASMDVFQGNDTLDLTAQRREAVFGPDNDGNEWNCVSFPR